MKKQRTTRLSTNKPTRHLKTSRNDEAPPITRELLEQAVLMPPIGQFKSTKEYMAYFKQESEKKQNAKRVAIEFEPEVFRWLQSQGKLADSRVNALLKDYIHMLEQHTH